jgi:hypothetical protein
MKDFDAITDMVFESIFILKLANFIAFMITGGNHYLFRLIKKIITIISTIVPIIKEIKILSSFLFSCIIKI